MNNTILEKLIIRIKRYYLHDGDDGEKGCYVGGRWLSVDDIIEFIKLVDNE